MNGIKLSLVVSIVVLCAVAARGLDRLILEPPAPASTQALAIPAPPAPDPQGPAAIKLSGSEEQRIQVSADGHYYADAEINGLRLKHMLVDTGATYVTLSYEDAVNIGIRPDPDDYSRETHTANGVTHVALANLREVRLGDIVLEDVPAVIGEPGKLDVSLLGMSFLSRLSRVEATENALALRR